MGKSKIARRKAAALQAKKAASHAHEQQHDGDAVQPVDTETAPAPAPLDDRGDPVAPAANGSMTPRQDRSEMVSGPDRGQE
jgi:hypothetical protein